MDAARQGQALRGIMPHTVAEAECIIKENCHIKVNKVATMLDVSHGSTHHIIHDIVVPQSVCKGGA
jgi:hypothetical protein